MSKTDGKEIRFAVVMYGGVSLAIYINGVAQELLKMCRATAEKGKADVQETTESVYRKISFLLSDKKLLDEFVKALETGNEAEIARIDAELENTKSENVLKTRFVVDVLTGTSAGGINAIYLAKALANNQDIKQLKDLWLSEGDIGVLINDKKSVADINLNAPEKARSLLNSQRMYLKLLEAFDGMDEDPCGSEISRFVEELDLFVPTTDFRGTTVPLRLFDKIVEEKRYRQVFHLRYDRNETDEKGKNKNDFKKRNNPMLALAARATSSFPFAFEPMRYGQAVSVIEEAFADWRERTEALKADVKDFFPTIIQKNGDPIDWEKRDLVDGGVLDNKPFSYAIDVLSKRRADFQVERKLLYIEPSPESFGSGKTKEEKPPDVLENAVASLSSLPSYETIREDLEKLLERNRLIERVNLIISSAEQDVFQQLISFGAGKNSGTAQDGKNTGTNFWKNKGLEDIVELKGRAVLPYYRLRIAALTDDIARLVTKINGVDEKSEYFEAIRKLVKIWRMKNFSDYKNQPAEKGTVMAFLWSFDLIYRLRRLRFVQGKASRLYFYDDDFKDEMCERFVKFVEIRTEREAESDSKSESAFVEESIVIAVKDWREFEQTINWTLCEKKIKKPETYRTKETALAKNGFIERKPSEILFLLQFQTNEDYQRQFYEAIEYFQSQLGEIFKDLQKKSKELSGAQKNLSEKVSEIKLEKEDLDKLLSLTEKSFTNKDTEDQQIKPIWNKFNRQINNAASELEAAFDKIFQEAREKIENLFPPDPDNFPPELNVNSILFKSVRGYLKHYYYNFDEYDQISFPIFYQTQVGEAAKVDVMRISPKDATGLINEEETGKQKLAGEGLFHFGAFLDRTWRWNDIMWGRLDGAERLITALLPDEKYAKIRKFLTREAQVKILEEEFIASNKETLQGVLAASLTKVSAGLEMREVIGEITGKIGDAAVKTELNKILRTCIDEKNVYDFVQKRYEVEKQLEPKSLLQVISRSTKVTGDIFEAIADDKAAAGSQMRWIARFGQIFWGLVEVAAPNSFWNKLFKQWLMLLYLFEIVLIVGSTIFVKPEVQQFGIMALILTLITHLTAITLHDYMRGGKFLYLLRFVAVGLMAILAISGAVFIYGLFFDADFWKKISGWQTDLDKYEHWQRLLPVSFLVLLFVATLVWRETQKLNVRFYGVITLVYVLLVFLIGGWITQLSNVGQGFDGLSPLISLEFPKSIGDVEHITRAFREDVVENLKWALAIDSFLFVPLYVGFLLFFSQLLRLRRNQWIIAKSKWFKKEAKSKKENGPDSKNWIAETKEKLFNISFLNLTVIVVSLCIVFAGLADLAENYFSYAALENPAVPGWKIQGISYAATVKWFLLALVTAVLSLIFLRKNWWWIFTLAFLIAAGIGFAALFNHALFKPFLYSQLIILPIISFLFIFFPEKFSRD